MQEDLNNSGDNNGILRVVSARTRNKVQQYLVEIETEPFLIWLDYEKYLDPFIKEYKEIMNGNFTKFPCVFEEPLHEEVKVEIQEKEVCFFLGDRKIDAANMDNLDESEKRWILSQLQGLLYSEFIKKGKQQ